MTQVELCDVHKAFGDAKALDALSLRVASGELVALLGPSGCGKTTTLRMIAGLDAPTAGRILFDGRCVLQRPVKDRNVGLVFQNYALFPHMTVEKNVAFGLSVRGLSRSEVTRRVGDILEIVQLSGFARRFPSQLSGGQRQRVALARTLVTRPSVLMMDEPLANLDTKLRAEMRGFIKSLQRELGVTTLFVTHDQIEAMELADRVAVMFDGTVAQYDPPDQLYQRPLSVHVAAFMGVTNIFEGRVTAGGRIETALGTLPCPVPCPVPSGAACHVMLRAEALDLHTEDPGGACPALSARITSRDFQGASVTYTLTCKGQTITLTETARRLIDPDTAVWLTISPQNLWVLPQATAPTPSTTET